MRCDGFAFERNIFPTYYTSQLYIIHTQIEFKKMEFISNSCYAVIKSDYKDLDKKERRKEIIDSSRVDKRTRVLIGI